MGLGFFFADTELPEFREPWLILGEELIIQISVSDIS